jgi:hypothetical protein
MIRTIGLTAAALMLAASAQAQGRGKGKGKQQAVRIDHGDRRGGVIRGDANRDVFRFDRRVPPGLAKKPGQMPPGQYKKRYNTYDGASVLGDIMRRRGYEVLRIVPAGRSQYVYYRSRDAAERRAVVRLGEDRLRFSNVPTSIVQAVLARLY